jgi:tetratricopeptide (TPR) repeat protein
MLRKLPLLCTLAAAFVVAHAAEQPAIEISSPHFVLVTDAGEKQGRHLLDNFERMRWMFQTLFPKVNVDPPAPIFVFAAKNKRGFQALEPAEYLAKGQLNLAGYFLTATDRNFILLRLDEESEHPFATVYHEYTHLQFRDSMDWMPLWFNEGIAEFFQNTEFRDKQVLLGQASADDILYLRQNSIIPLPALFQVDHNSPYYHEENKGSVFYAESWVLVHYLEVSDREKGTHRLSEYLRLVSQHVDSVTAAQQAFGDLKQLQSALASYIQQQQYKEFILSSAAAPIDSASYEVRTLSPAEYDSDRAEILAYVGRSQEARTLLDGVMKADPKSALARETMGYLEFRAGNNAAARKWYEDAVQLNSRSYLAHYYFAAMSGSSADYAQNPAIETSLRTAIQLNPNFAPPYDLLAGWYADRHEKLDEALTLSRKAIQLDRANLNYRLNIAGIYMSQANFDMAEQVLHAALPLAKTTEQKTSVDGRLEQIAAFKARARAPAMEASVDVNAVTLPDHNTNQPSSPSNFKIVVADKPPRHPVEVHTGPKHTVLGAIGEVHCAYPAQLELQINVAGGSKPVALYVSDFSQLNLSAIGFTPKKEMDPCHELNGMKAKVVYAESSDKTVDGQIVSVELHK